MLVYSRNKLASYKTYSQQYKLKYIDRIEPRILPVCQFVFE